MNSQILGLAEALGRPFERKRLAYKPGWSGWWPAYLQRTTLAGLNVEGSDRLASPWPDLVLTAGRRHEPVCRWIRRSSGGKTRSVFLGRTWADSRHFDLVVTTPQYRLPPAPNVLENPTTLHRVTAGRLRRAAELWRPQLGGLPRPRVAVLAGGSSGPFPFGPIAAERLGREAAEAAGDGSLLVTTSARTSGAAAEALRKSLPPSVFFYRYRPDDDDNPYFGLLALADAVVVTGDSIAMVSEALATGKPVLLFDTGTGRRSMRGDVDGEGNDVELGSDVFRLLMGVGARRMTRDITLVHRQLTASGQAAWLGDPWPRGATVDSAVVDRTVRRVLSLVER